MTNISDEQLVVIREKIHALNNVLNTMSMQAELVRLLSNDSQSREKISACVDTITRECKKGGAMTLEVGSIIKIAGDANESS